MSIKKRLKQFVSEELSTSTVNVLRCPNDFYQIKCVCANGVTKIFSYHTPSGHWLVDGMWFIKFDLVKYHWACSDTSMYQSALAMYNDNDYCLSHVAVFNIVPINAGMRRALMNEVDIIGE